MSLVRNHKDLKVYKLSFEVAIKIHTITSNFPKEETYALTDQIRRSSRSVCANLAEAWRKRKYPKNFISKISDCEAELAETQVWMEFAIEVGYIKKEVYHEINNDLEKIAGMLVKMTRSPEKWSY